MPMSRSGVPHKLEQKIRLLPDCAAWSPRATVSSDEDGWRSHRMNLHEFWIVSTFMTLDNVYSQRMRARTALWFGFITVRAS